MNSPLSAVRLVVVLGLGVAAPGRADTHLTWEARFARPPADARILKIIHGWPDAPEQQDQWIRRLSAQGFGGVVCNVSFQDYLESESKWAAFTRAVQAAKDAGWTLWLYDEHGYPSGNAGGLVLRGHPEWEARGLLVTEAETTGGPVTLELPPGPPVLVAAYPVREDGMELAARVELSPAVQDGRLSWTAPAGRWRVLAITEDRLFEGTHAAGNLHAKLPYPNLLLPEPTARFIELTYGSYARHLGTNLGRFFAATFTDEPSLMSLFLEPMPYRPLPWAPHLPAEFQRRRGYALDLAHLPMLVGDTRPGPAKLRHDFWLTVGELVAENYFGQIQTHTRRLGVASGGHLLAEENLVHHVPLYGDFFRCLRRMDAPGMDCLTSVPAEVPWPVARLVSSAAALEGRPLVMSETSDHAQVWRAPGDRRPRRGVTEGEIRGTCNRLLVAGVNTITSYYSFTDLDDEALRRLNAWVGRGAAALRGGHQVADLAVVYPVESLWVRFVPSRHWTREAAAAARLDHLYRSAVEALFAARREFTVVDSRTLAEAAVESGVLAHGPLRWRVVILPGVDTLPLAAWENLARFVRRGGVVIALGALPTHSEREFPSARVRARAGEMFGTVEASAREPRVHSNAAGGAGIFLPAGAEGLLPLVLDGVLAPELKVAGGAAGGRSPLRATHRRIEGREIYFVINDSARPWAGRVEFAAEGEGERWSLATGRCEDRFRGGAGELSLEPWDAAVFRFTTPRPPARRPLGAGALPGLGFRTLAPAAPTLLRGEFVRAELRPAAGPTTNAPAWEVAAALTRGRVDTWAFAQFHFSPPLDLSAADCLALETWVPEGQTTANQLLVLLREEGGGDFFAETGRSLAGPGWERSFLPLERFQLAGWSRDPDGELDRTRISDLRVGWGGYLGTEGEQVRFRLAPPQIGARMPGKP